MACQCTAMTSSSSALPLEALIYLYLLHHNPEQRITRRKLGNHRKSSGPTRTEALQIIMLWHNVAASTAVAMLGLPSKVASAPLALLGSLTGEDTAPSNERSVPYAYHTCPNGGTWSRLEDDFTSFRDSDWVIETGAQGVSTGKDGMTLDLSQDMVRRKMRSFRRNLLTDPSSIAGSYRRNHSCGALSVSQYTLYLSAVVSDARIVAAGEHPRKSNSI